MAVSQPLAADRVKAVIDGDTLLMQDGTHVRLIGIDAPELGLKGRASEPLARQAKTTLQQLLKKAGNDVRLEPGAEARDQYGRLLAHVFDAKGRNLGVALLQKGLATLMVFPPNTRRLTEYERAQSQARRQRVGLWGGRLGKPKRPSQLSDAAEAVQWVTGTVTSVSVGREAVFVQLDDSLLLKSRREEWTSFASILPLIQVGTHMTVLGELYRYRGQMRMRLRHRAQLVGDTER